VVLDKKLKDVDNKSNEANFFWVGNLSEYELSNFRSFKENGFIVNIWTYQDINNQNNNLDKLKEFNIKNAQEILDVSLLRKFRQRNQKSSMASFANIFRLELLNKYGGWWFDADCICIKNVQDFIELSSRNDFIIGREYKDYTGNSVLYFKKKDVLEGLIQKTWEKIHEKNFNFFWGEIGPDLISDVFLDKRIMDKTLDEKYFYKISADEFSLFFTNNKNKKENLRLLLEDSYVCHTWNEMFNRYFINKKKLPPKNSYIGEHIQIHSDRSKKLKTYTFIFYLRFIPVLYIFIRVFYRIKIIFNNLTNR